MMNLKKDEFETLRKIDEKTHKSQRQLAKKLGFSLGKLNYCLNSLKDKGLIKLKNFKDSKNKFGYAYILTPRGFSQKLKLTLDYMKRKASEYDELKEEADNLIVTKNKNSKKN